MLKLSNLRPLAHRRYSALKIDSLYIYLFLCDHHNRPHYGFCSSVRPFIRPSVRPSVRPCS